MTDSWLIRAHLRRDASAAALAPLLVPSDTGARLDAGHRLIWALLGDGPDRKRDFLWRETGPGAWMALSARPPRADLGLFEVQSKPFAPVLRSGQYLGFSLKVNPVRAAAPAGKGSRGKRVDVVTQALRGLPAEERGDARDRAVQAWLERQGAQSGFTLHPGRMLIEAEDWVRIPRADSGAVSFCAVTMSGVLSVHNPEAFLARLRSGFGAARGFGCGLMLIRPVNDGPSDEEEDDLA